MFDGKTGVCNDGGKGKMILNIYGLHLQKCEFSSKTMIPVLGLFNTGYFQ